MRWFFISIATFLLLGHPSIGSAQHTDYNKHLQKLQASIPEWRAAVEQIDPGRLNLSYQMGHAIDEDKRIALMNLYTADRFINLIRSRRRLSDEFSLFGLLGEINSSMLSLSDDLWTYGGSGDSPDLDLITGWAKPLGDITRGPLTQEITFQLTAVGAMADAVEARCIPPTR